MNKFLLVDDEDVFRNRLQKSFEKRGFRVFSAADYHEAVKLIKREKPDYAVVELKMPGKSGLDLIRDGLKIHPSLKIMVLTGYGSIATAVEAIKSGALHYLSKPADAEEILASFNKDSKGEKRRVSGEFPAPSLARTEWEHINRVLADCRGNISKTARRLGIHRRTLQRKLYKYPPKS
ncbi:MAG: response regulator transcription factor [Desulfobia sp.]